VIAQVLRLLAVLAASSILAMPLLAQRISLRIAPPEGDTLHMQLKQRFDIEPGESTDMISGELRVWTHAIVMRRSRGYTDLVSVTDSVKVFPANITLRPLLQAQAALEGKTVRLRIHDNGGMTVGSGPDAVFGGGTAMPSMLPAHPVAVGESWTRDMTIPLSATGSSTANVRTRFRLDSLTNHGGEAYISFRGAVSHDHAQDGGGITGTTVGTLAGMMEVDRRLEWITDSEMTVDVISNIQPLGRPAIHSRMRITQSLMALPGY
jgi:hypothetical protein